MTAKNVDKQVPVATLGEPGFIRTTDNVNLFYRDWGVGETVVFLSGWAMSSDTWCYQMLHLNDQGFRCVAYDMRGHGRSSDPGRGYDFDTMAQDLAAVLNVLELQSVTLVGHSIGCGVITRYLTRYGSGRIKRIAMLGTVTPCMRKAADNPDGVPDEAIDYFLTKQLMQNFPGWIEGSKGPFFGEKTPTGMDTWLTQIALSTSGKALLECSRSLQDADFRKELTNIDVPTLILHGDKDVSAPLELTARRTAALIPGAKLKEYANVAHALFLTDVDRVNADLLEFIGGKKME
ncbi:alpha/beta fold hydrolase [Solimicrobium silvestre]|uniref:Putative hydrolases or acyltransferases (Alpha/beta hydrolase superfamily) n=1 Tax=Solimicrobium silvestre TaxID=2099400 RepID=A0A2S9H2V5_9BURK|nr:alpha/beta hydrolase [Solimicrobium silvestre]PRC94311.1 putative hydrolases or acyltransferases (alpha/beta hydrolase superfamily) [Solimicrobium silvestre]